MVLGSIKSNIGHPSMAAAVAVFIKTMQAIRHMDMVTQHVWYRLLRPVSVLTEFRSWPVEGRPR
ncbi:hypothetical protein A8144_03945 [Mycobacterium leprae 3125609]|nr:hypothetical protein A8144_03945 [Mycobacterium leprae 3125609]OAX71921.1 hypothetical protein A3216_02985 [Mycobacterium leprae 7935681]